MRVDSIAVVRLVAVLVVAGCGSSGNPLDGTLDGSADQVTDIPAASDVQPDSLTDAARDGTPDQLAPDGSGEQADAGCPGACCSNADCTGPANSVPTCALATHSCGWSCQADYYRDAPNNRCIHELWVPCDTNNNNPLNSSDVVAYVLQTYSTTGGWTAPALCGWECNASYTRAGSSCVLQQASQFGNPTYFGTPGSFLANYLLGSAVVVSTGGSVKNLGVYVGNSAGSLVQLALYSDAAGAPGPLVAYTAATTTTVGSMQIPVATPAQISTGTYWIMGVYSADTGVGKEASGTSTTIDYVSFTFGTPLPSVFPTTHSTYTSGRINYWVTVQ